MKKLSFLFFLLVACITAFAGNVISGKKAAPLRAAAKMPTFCSETDANPQYYIVTFNRSGTCMSESTNGTDNCIRLYNSTGDASQQWKLVGTQDNFQFVNKNGNYAVVSSESIYTSEGGTNPNPIRASKSAQPGGYKLVVSSCMDNGAGFEVIANSKSGNNYMNLWGDPRGGNTIGFWKVGDQNNVVSFTKPGAMNGALDYKTVGVTGYSPANMLTLWYDEPATTAQLYSGGQGYSNWMEYALPIGDGQFGASLFGDRKSVV